MRFIKVAILSVAFGLAAGLTVASTAIAQEVTLRFQHFISPKGSVPAKFMVPWAEKIEKESGGRIKIEIYPAMQLGGTPPALFDQIRDNVIDGGWTILGYTPGRFPGVEVFELPFISSKSAENTSRAAHEFYEKYLQEELSDVKILALHVHGPGIVHTKGSEIKSVADFSGLKLRTPTRIGSSILKALGATPVGMPVPQLPESISKGVVNGGIIPWEIVPPLKIHELATSHTEVGGNRSLYNTVFIWAMNNDVYNKLPDDLKAVIDANSGIEAAAWAGRAMDEGDIPGRALTQKVGNTIHIIDGEELAKMKEMTAPIIEQWINDMTAKGRPAADMVKDAKALIAKYD